MLPLHLPSRSWCMVEGWRWLYYYTLGMREYCNDNKSTCYFLMVLCFYNSCSISHHESQSHLCHMKPPSKNDSISKPRLWASNPPINKSTISSFHDCSFASFNKPLSWLFPLPTSPCRSAPAPLSPRTRVQWWASRSGLRALRRPLLRRWVGFRQSRDAGMFALQTDRLPGMDSSLRKSKYGQVCNHCWRLT